MNAGAVLKTTVLLCGFTLFGSLAFALVQGYETDRELSNAANRMLKELHQRTMPFLNKVNATKPTTDELPQGWGSVTKDTSSIVLYGLNFNIEGTIVTVALATQDTT